MDDSSGIGDDPVRALANLRLNLLAVPVAEPGGRTPGRSRRSRRRWRKKQAAERLFAGECWTDSGLVLTTPIGTPVDPRNFLRAWHELLKSAEINKRPLHEARHAVASLMLSEGVPLKVVQETLVQGFGSRVEARRRQFRPS